MTKIKIAGFGGCMIKGVPFTPDDSYFSIAIKRIEKEFPVESKIVALGGFPIDRHTVFREKRLVPWQPDIVVVAFSSGDARRVVGIREQVGRLRFWKHHEERVHVVPDGPIEDEYMHTFAQLKPPLAPLGLKAHAVRLTKAAIAAACVLPSRTSRPVFREAMLDLLKRIQAIGAFPVVIQPYPMLDLWSNHKGHQFHTDIDQMKTTLGFATVDVRAVLAPFPYHDVFLSDGMHLTRFAHERMGDALFETLQSVLKDRKAQACVTPEKRTPP